MTEYAFKENSKELFADSSENDEDSIAYLHSGDEWLIHEAPLRALVAAANDRDKWKHIAQEAMGMLIRCAAALAEEERRDEV